jgi:hypothetical protein
MHACKTFILVANCLHSACIDGTSPASHQVYRQCSAGCTIIDIDFDIDS